MNGNERLDRKLWSKSCSIINDNYYIIQHINLQFKRHINKTQIYIFEKKEDKYDLYRYRVPNTNAIYIIQVKKKRRDTAH